MATRGYRMRARATAAEETRIAILDAAIELAYEFQRVDVPLEQVARRAGRSVQTILRPFGSGDGLIAAAIRRGTAQVVEERRATPGDIEHALDLLVEHYERRGRFVLRLLAAGDDGDAARVTDPGRLVHRAWVEETFAPALAHLSAARRIELVDLLVVATDVSAWALLRLDRALPVAAVRSRMGVMVRALLAQAEETDV